MDFHPPQPVVYDKPSKNAYGKRDRSGARHPASPARAAHSTALVRSNSASKTDASEPRAASFPGGRKKVRKQPAPLIDDRTEFALLLAEVRRLEGMSKQLSTRERKTLSDCTNDMKLMGEKHGVVAGHFSALRFRAALQEHLNYCSCCDSDSAI